MSEKSHGQPAARDLVPTIDLSGLNDRQRKIAETLDEPLFVEAGAGSGKTFTLTQRIAWALSPGSGTDGEPFLESLDQVLVITFTEAAAREIKERVRTTLRRAHMGEAALAVDEAWISTIHGMCRRILSRHALDLGLDPAFDVVADARQAALFDRAMDEVMRAARSDEAFAPALAEFDLGTYSPQSGYTGAMGIVSRLVGEGRSLSGGVDALLPAGAPRDSVAQAVRDLTMRMEELGAERLTKAAAEKVAPALEALRGLEGLDARERTPERVGAALEGIELPQARGKLKEAVSAAKSALALARAEVSFARVAPLAGALLELARRVDERYTQIKREESCLDNDDLVRLALLAVRDNEEVRRAYAGRFRLVMVDEFQDTDEMQLELIGLLAGEDARHLCTVGDAQQSIYRFRGADVSVFRGRGSQVSEKNVVRLDTNYRSHADVLSLVERVCTGGDGPARGTMPAFMHLDANPARRDGYHARELPRIDIEVCAGKGRAGRASRHQTATMAAQVADALAWYRDAGERPGDMALLLGVTTHADLYIDAIRARGMECVVTGGSTFTSTEEVKVVRALLHTLANPADTQSGLFPLLASEMFGLDANDFCELGTRAQEKLDAPTKRPIDRGLADMTFYRDREPSARLRVAHEVISRALEEVRWRPVADVCADAVRDSGWLARLEAGGAEGLARAANVLAAVRYVRELTAELGLGAARAATEFDLWLAAAKVPPASLAGDEGTGGGTVRVMTVHASKGLEFGVCAVAECWGNPRSDAQVAVGTLGGEKRFVLRPKEAPKLADVDPEELEESADKSAEMPLAARYLALRALDDEAEAQERARLLYVALTRAREALVVGVAGASGKEGVCSALAASTLDALSDGAWEAAPGTREVDYGGTEPARLRCVVVEDQGRGAEKCVTADSAGTLAGFDGELPADPAEVVRLGAPDGPEAPHASFDLYEPDQHARPVSPSTWRARDGVFSYSSVYMTLTSEPGVTSAPPAPTRAQREAEASGAPETQDADRATNLGSAFHELAQAMVESGRAADERRVAAQVRRWNLSERAERRLRAALSRWERSSVRAEALSWPVVRAEVPFFQRVDSPHGDYLEGAMDLLCTDGAGKRVLVVDYKTGDAGLSPEEVRARHAMQAEFYAGVLLREGFEQVECAFVCVERDDPDAPGEPLVARYAFEVRWGPTVLLA
ncbi:UvrD-helicase domain-containing protein [Thermophilibacter provencensis]|uniref:DNA 3'-5' helicase n=1 Tax=Thermophilibacter provencensis TaxID=1852386 RepID=A0ABT7V589_9ACTN|nr:UvrD-helicase domain-containing protein [Thermophilibacter provencensis]MDM8271777.1 UvrD-helicase domain-containing protein [Thermophilibacter provencensis]